MRVRRFLSSAGLEIVVGQDDRSNDALSLRFGHADDLWFHVSGVPGSHVILRCGEEKFNPDRESIREAAGLAAWFSKMKTGGNVTVNYCRVKDVSKPRKAKPGSVSIRNARKIKVQPKLLQEQDTPT